MKRNRSRLCLEQLETRDAPATLVSSTRLTYQDIDGDNVTVTFSKPILTSGNVDGVFGAGFVTNSNTARQQLQKIDLTGIGVPAAGTTISVAATRSAVTGGDGFATLGQINATGIDLGAVTIDGDLGQILAGDAPTLTPGLAGLTVYSLGRFGTSTGAPDLHTVVRGKLGSLTVKSDVKEAFIEVTGGGSGQIGRVTIGGSLIGGASNNSGSIVCSATMGPVKIGGNVQGGSGSRSAAITSVRDMASVTVVGSIIGGTGLNSGTINSNGAIGAVKITGDVQGGVGQGSGVIFSLADLAGLTIGGALIGGAGASSGAIISDGAIGAVRVAGVIQGGDGSSSGRIATISTLGGVTIGGSLLGGAGIGSGHIFSSGAMGAVRVAGTIQGSGGDQSGGISTNSTLAGVTIGGSLIGGTAFESGRISSSGAMGAVRITGDVRGEAIESGEIESFDTLGGVTIGGSLIGGTGFDSGRIHSGGAMGAVRIVGDIEGGGGHDSGEILGSSIAGVTVGGSIVGGSEESSGLILSFGELGPVRVTGSVLGGAGGDSGEITAGGAIASMTIGGSLIGGTGIVSGTIFSRGPMASLKIAGNVIGGSATGTADLDQSGHIEARRIAVLTIGGALIAGTDNTTGLFTNNGTIRVADDFGSITIGNVIGNVTNPAIISARGSATPTATSDIAIGSLHVLGRVEFAQILAGIDSFPGNPVNADAQIGQVTVGGDWIASSIAAGAVAGADGFFGTGDDARMTGLAVKDVATASSKIISLTILGQALGTVGGTDSFGVVAEQVGAVRIGGTPLVLTSGGSNDHRLVGVTDDLHVLEVAP